MTGQNYEKEALLIAANVAPFVFLMAFASVIALTVMFQWKQWKDDQADLKALAIQEILLERINRQNHLLKQLSRDLHNNPGQLLFVAKINLNILEEQEQPADNLHYISKANDLLTQTINELRSLIKRMDEEAAPAPGLLQGIRYELNKIRQVTRADTRLLVEGEVYRLSDEREIILTGVVKAIFDLALEKAKAPDIEVKIQFEQKEFRLIIGLTGETAGCDPNLADKEKLTMAVIQPVVERCALIDFNCRLDTDYRSRSTFYLSAPVRAY